MATTDFQEEIDRLESENRAMSVALRHLIDRMSKGQPMTLADRAMASKSLAKPHTPVKGEASAFEVASLGGGMVRRHG